VLADVTEVEGLEVAEMHGVEQHQYRHHLAVGLAGCSPVTLSSLEQAVNTAADAISRAAIVRMFFFIVEFSLFPDFFIRSTIARAHGLYAAACHEVRLLLQLDDFHRRSLIVFSFHVLECFVGMFYKCEF